MTQQQVADRMGVSKGRVSQIERGKISGQEVLARYKHPDYPRQQWDDLVPMLESGALDPPIGSVFSLDEVGEAIRTLDERRATGKVLVRVR